MKLAPLPSSSLDPVQAADSAALMKSLGKRSIQAQVLPTRGEGVVIRTTTGHLINLAQLPGAKAGRRLRLTLDPASQKVQLEWIEEASGETRTAREATESRPLPEKAARPPDERLTPVARWREEGVALPVPAPSRGSDEESRSSQAERPPDARHRIVLQARLPRTGRTRIQAESIGGVLRTFISVEDPGIRLRLGARLDELNRRLRQIGFARTERPQVRILDTE